MRSADPARLLDRSDPRPGPDRAALAAEDQGRLRVLIAELPDNQREVLELKFRHGLSYGEIGAVTENPIGQVSWLIHRAMRALRERMASDIQREALEGMEGRA